MTAKTNVLTAKAFQMQLTLQPFLSPPDLPVGCHCNANDIPTCSLVISLS